MRWIARNSSGKQPNLLRRPRSHCNAYSRLKKVQGKKKRDAEAAEVQKRAIAQSAAAEIVEAEVDIHSEGVEGGSDLLSSKDEDVIF